MPPSERLTVRKLLKAIINPLLTLCNCLMWRRYDVKNSQHAPITLFKVGIIQKIIGFNRHVPWPVHFTTQVLAPEKINPGTRCPGFSLCCFIDGRNGIVIGKNVRIGPKVNLISQDHANDDYDQYIETKPIIIGDNSLLTSSCTLLPGVELGPHTIVAAGAVVTKSFPQGGQVLAGCPAKPVKKLEAYKAA